MSLIMFYGRFQGFPSAIRPTRGQCPKLRRVRFDGSTVFEQIPTSTALFACQPAFVKPLSASICFNGHAFTLDRGEYRVSLIASSSSSIIVIAPMSAKAPSWRLDSTTSQPTTVYRKKIDRVGHWGGLLCNDHAYDSLALIVF